jgi:aarF domain-containing kinase
MMLGTQGVYVPEMLMAYTTQRVLVMEWVEGVRLRSAGMGASAATRAEDLKLVDVGVRCSLEQMLEKGAA